jgi:hypothetical protein
MTPTQLKYAMSRVDAALNDKLADLNERFRSKFGEKEKLAALKRGAFTINKKATSTSDAIVYPEAPPEMDREEFKAKERQLRSEASRVKDELILGNEQEALKLIREFKELKV